MKLTKLAAAQLTQAKEVPGLLSCELEYEIKSGKGRLEYTGPRFSPDVWHPVLSFFRWTHKEMNSESQVRMYVNLKLKRWGAWAFPQEARTGMSAREISVQETPEQAVERFASWGSEPSAEWLYFCTVHHHCSAGAFQSDTDERNEKNQDGLHITIGKMDADRHDLHARFYLGGNCFEPDLSLFWDLDPALAQQVPPNMLDALARFQMCEKVVMDFPDAWRNNVIERKSETRSLVLTHQDWDFEKPDRPDWFRADDALRDISGNCSAHSLVEEDVLAALQDPALNLIVQACLKHHVTPEDILQEAQAYQLGY